MDVIIKLQAVYRQSTGINIRMGMGPFFVELIEEFLTAMGQGPKIKQDYVSEKLKYERKRAHKNIGK